ncbi:MAG TPA: Vms1/Ankzf1 family peptidyl-tRNA hydrolase, partial [Acidimicrobiales bacterium]|nr:Vms1/Ankzf1 family peptidyl-tRNA hydrolase [Acidimicrobiales bacterium]
AAAVQDHVGEDALGIVATPAGVVVTSLADVDESEEVLQVEALPRWVPFLRDRFERRPHVVVRADRTGAQVARVERGEISRDTEVGGEDEQVTKVNAGGWSQKRFQNHAEHNWDQNAQEVAEAVGREADAIGAELVVVTGDERAVNLIGEHLPERFRDRLALDDHQPFDDESDAAVFDRAEVLLRDRVGREIVAALERFGEHRGRGEGFADQVEDVLAALRQGAVGTLLLSGDSDQRVHLALDEPMQVATDPEHLTDLGFTDVVEARLTDAAVHAALAGGAEVLIIPEHGPNSPDGPLGAILRY